MELQSKAALEKDPAMDYMLLQGVRFAFRIHQVCNSTNYNNTWFFFHFIFPFVLGLISSSFSFSLEKDILFTYISILPYYFWVILYYVHSLKNKWESFLLQVKPSLFSFFFFLFVLCKSEC